MPLYRIVQCSGLLAQTVDLVEKALAGLGDLIPRPRAPSRNDDFPQDDRSHGKGHKGGEYRNEQENHEGPSPEA